MTTQLTPSAPVLPPLPAISPKDAITYDFIRYVSGYTVGFVHQYATDYALAAIKAQGDPVDYVLELLVAAGHITREKAFHARDIARAFHPAAITAKDSK